MTEFLTALSDLWPQSGGVISTVLTEAHASLLIFLGASFLVITIVGILVILRRPLSPVAAEPPEHQLSQQILISLAEVAARLSALETQQKEDTALFRSNIIELSDNIENVSSAAYPAPGGELLPLDRGEKKPALILAEILQQQESLRADLNNIVEALRGMSAIDRIEKNQRELWQDVLRIREKFEASNADGMLINNIRALEVRVASYVNLMRDEFGELKNDIDRLSSLLAKPRVTVEEYKGSGGAKENSEEESSIYSNPF